MNLAWKSPLICPGHDTRGWIHGWCPNAIDCGTTNPHKETRKTQEMSSLFCASYISEQKQQKGKYKTQHYANGDECHPAWEAKPLNLMTPLHLRQKKTEVESHRIPMSCLIRRGKAMNAMSRGVSNSFGTKCIHSFFMLSRSCLHYQRKKLQQFAVRVWKHSVAAVKVIYPDFNLCNAALGIIVPKKNQACVFIPCFLSVSPLQLLDIGIT